MAIPTPENLERVAGLLDSGIRTVPIQRSYSLENAGDGLHALGATHTQGKLGLRVA